MFWKTVRVAGCFLLGFWTQDVGADWSRFGRYAAILEIRLEASEALIRLDVLDEPSAFRRLGWVWPQKPPTEWSWPIEIGPQKGSLGPLSVTRVEPEPGQPTSLCLIGRLPLNPSSRTLSLKAPKDIEPSALGVVVLDRGVPLADLGPFDSALKIERDLSNPWQSRFANDERRRRHTAPRLSLQLEPGAVRQSFLIEVPALGAQTPFLIQGVRALRQGEEAPELRAQLTEWLHHRAPLKINGHSVSPSLEQLDFVAYNRKGLAPLPSEAPTPGIEGLIGAVLVEPLDQTLETLEVEWTEFPPPAGERPVTVSLALETFEGSLSPQNPRFQWSRDEALDPDALNLDRRLTTLTQVPVTQEAPFRTALEALLLNTYQAFALIPEEAAYDRLALSLADPLLESLYLDQRRSLLRQSRGLGGTGRVHRVELITLESLKPPGSEAIGVSLTEASKPGVIWLNALWKAQGEVSHWGHSHPREHLYQAHLGLVRESSGGLKIAFLEFQQGQRLEEALKP